MKNRIHIITALLLSCLLLTTASRLTFATTATELSITEKTQITKSTQQVFNAFTSGDYHSYALFFSDEILFIYKRFIIDQIKEYQDAVEHDEKPSSSPLSGLSAENIETLSPASVVSKVFTHFMNNNEPEYYSTTIEVLNIELNDNGQIATVTFLSDDPDDDDDDDDSGTIIFIKIADEWKVVGYYLLETHGFIYMVTSLLTNETDHEIDVTSEDTSTKRLGDVFMKSPTPTQLN